MGAEAFYDYYEIDKSTCECALQDADSGAGAPNPAVYCDLLQNYITPCSDALCMPSEFLVDTCPTPELDIHQSWLAAVNRLRQCGYEFEYVSTLGSESSKNDWTGSVNSSCAGCPNPTPQQCTETECEDSIGYYQYSLVKTVDPLMSC